MVGRNGTARESKGQAEHSRGGKENLEEFAVPRGQTAARRHWENVTSAA